LAEVAGVNDQIGVAQELDALLGKPPGAARQMGVRDQGEPDGSVPVASALALGALALGEHALEISGLLGAAPVLALLVRRGGLFHCSMLLGGPLLLELAQLLGAWLMALGHGTRVTRSRPRNANTTFKGGTK
jgi:hypothetical protein